MATLQEADLKAEMKQPEEIGATIATYIGPEAYGIVFVES
jgi:fatty acid-binding protein DegV